MRSVRKCGHYRIQENKLSLGIFHSFILYVFTLKNKLYIKNWKTKMENTVFKNIISVLLYIFWELIINSANDLFTWGLSAFAFFRGFLF